MRSISITIVFVILSTCLWSQKYKIERSTVAFFSHAPIEDITAENTASAGVFESSRAEIAFSIPIKQFQFAKSLMQEHFNERYMDSEKYPKSTFQGKIDGYDATATGKQNVTARGKLTIHGVTRTINVPGTIEKQGDLLNMNSKFIVKLEDYKIKIPQLMWQNIAEQVEVTLDFTFRPQ